MSVLPGRRGDIPRLVTSLDDGRPASTLPVDKIQNFISLKFQIINH